MTMKLTRRTNRLKMATKAMTMTKFRSTWAKLIKAMITRWNMIVIKTQETLRNVKPEINS